MICNSHCSNVGRAASKRGAVSPDMRKSPFEYAALIELASERSNGLPIGRESKSISTQHIGV
jgi:hypothetical protein